MTGIPRITGGLNLKDKFAQAAKHTLGDKPKKQRSPMPVITGRAPQR